MIFDDFWGERSTHATAAVVLLHMLAQNFAYGVHTGFPYHGWGIGKVVQSLVPQRISGVVAHSRGSQVDEGNGSELERRAPKYVSAEGWGRYGLFALSRVPSHRTASQHLLSSLNVQNMKTSLGTVHYIRCDPT